ncbi:antibiotic biosynthesis monooxygenase family protein [Thiolapillus sp.]
MYAVIFRAVMAEPDDSYITTARRMRELAKERYGCREFTSVTENGVEISISWWDSEQQIQEWKNDPEHLQAQELGQKKWYRSYSVQIVKVIRTYEG